MVRPSPDARFPAAGIAERGKRNQTRIQGHAAGPTEARKPRWNRTIIVLHEIEPAFHQRFVLLWRRGNLKAAGVVCRSDFCAIGRYGQLVYLSPQHHTVFVRTGPGRGRWGDRDWTGLFYFAAARM